MDRWPRPPSSKKTANPDETGAKRDDCEADEIYDPRYDCDVRIPRRRGEFSAASYQRLYRRTEETN